jgi:ribosomal protein S18 acetylase RimI-like enzyme
MKSKITQCTIDDISQLKKLAYSTFDESFRPMNTQETIDTYLSEAFTTRKLTLEIMTNGCEFYFIYSDEELAGYLKINYVPAQTDINDPESVEIERIYVKKEFKGKGLGKQLMDYAEELAEKAGKKYLWLGVWEKNGDAIEFYKHINFTITGEHKFKIGDEIQTDLIMKKEITK